ASARSGVGVRARRSARERRSGARPSSTSATRWTCLRSSATSRRLGAASGGNHAFALSGLECSPTRPGPRPRWVIRRGLAHFRLRCPTRTERVSIARGMQTLRRTPLYDRHVALGARMVPFAGWEMPVQYEGVIPEHKAVRTDAGVFDVSHMGEIEV